LELQPGLADAHASRGLAFFTVGRHAEAETEFEQAAALDPHSFEAHFFSGRNCFSQGQYERAEAFFLRAASLAPDDYRTWGHLQMIYVSLNRGDDAKEASRQGLNRAEKEVTAHPDNASALCFGAILLAEMGDGDVAVLHNIGCCYAKLGMADRAIDCLEHQLAASPIYNRWSLSWMKQDSDLDSIRNHPRFLEFISRLQARRSSAKLRHRETSLRNRCTPPC
jgi:adenylate cyclase